MQYLFKSKDSLLFNIWNIELNEKKNENGLSSAIGIKKGKSFNSINVGDKKVQFD